MATEAVLTYLGRLFITQLCPSLTSDSSDFAAPATPMDCPTSDPRTAKTLVNTWKKVTDYFPMQYIYLRLMLLCISLNISVLWDLCRIV